MANTSVQRYVKIEEFETLRFLIFSLHCKRSKTTKSLQCGLSVTFKHSDFEENTFYCANCSGWFLVKNADKQSDKQNVSQITPAITSDDLNEDKGSVKQRKIARPQILMEHVSHIHAFLNP